MRKERGGLTLEILAVSGMTQHVSVRYDTEFQNLNEEKVNYEQTYST
jgi:hypothetical protein